MLDPSHHIPPHTRRTQTARRRRLRRDLAATLAALCAGAAALAGTQATPAGADARGSDIRPATVSALTQMGFSRPEARSLVRNLEAGGARRNAALRVIAREPSRYGASAAILAARSDVGAPAAPLRVGRIPADYREALAPPAGDPSAAIEVVRPERTIVRDADTSHATILGGLALAVALGGAGYALVRTRSLQRHAAEATGTRPAD